MEDNRDGLVLGSEKEVQDKIKELGPGWESLPADDLEKGLKGELLFRDNDGEEECHWLLWPMFEKELVCDKEIVTASDLLKFVKSEPKDVVFSCDKPKSLMLGFISYKQANQGISVLRLAKLAEIKKLNELEANELMEFSTNKA